MPVLLARILDLLILAASAALFGACLTSVLTTGAYGWAVPVAPYMYEASDFYADAALAGTGGLLALLALERFARVRASESLRAAAFFIAALLALYLGPPSPQVFGNTWAPGEATRELFLAQLDMVVPIALAAVVLRCAARAVWRRVTPPRRRGSSE